MKTWMPHFVLLALLSIVAWGCAGNDGASTVSSSGSSSSHGDDGHSHDDDGHSHGPEGHSHDDDQGHAEDGDATVAVALYCGDCGHGYAKGAEHACDAEHEKCTACGFHKGAELCCKIEGDFAGKQLCASCGQIAGTADCCKEGAEVCAGCGLHKGAPLCCKLAKADAPPAETPPADAPPAETPADGDAAPAKKGDS